MTNRTSLALALMTLCAMMPAHAEAPACGADIDACVRTLVLENIGYVAACSAAYPAVKPVYARAIKHWAVLRMPIPGLADVTREGTAPTINASFAATEALRNLSEEERNKECSTRLANLTTATPTLAGHAWSLPPDALRKYAK